MIKQSLQANSAVMKDPEQDTGAEHLPHDSEQHDMKNNVAGMVTKLSCSKISSDL